MKLPYVNIHTHRFTGRGIELRTAGVHPWHADSESVEQSLSHLEGVQAIGEIGLDFACGVNRDKQMEIFQIQLQAAERLQLPVVLHCVKAFEPTMRLLSKYRLAGVVFHGFIGSPEQARQALAKGYHLSFGERTFASPRTLAALRITPLGQLFVETDQSDLPIEEIYTRIAAARGEEVALLQRNTLHNYEHLFEHQNG